MAWFAGRPHAQTLRFQFAAVGSFEMLDTMRADRDCFAPWSCY
jgi:hypothetical protein